MIKLTKETLIEIFERSGSGAATIYMPTYKLGAEQRQNLSRYKNMLREVENKLANAGNRGDSFAKSIEQASALLVDDAFWLYQNEGLAAFIGENYFDYLKLPITASERASVGKYFELAPALKALSFDVEFYVLALNLKDVKLYKATKYEIDEIDVGLKPTNIESVAGVYDTERSLQFHSGAPGNISVFHGHGTPKDEDKKILDEFFRRLASSLTDAVRDELPLAIVGGPYSAAAFKSVLKRPGTIEQTINVNPESLDKEKILELAREAVEPLFREEFENVSEKFGENLASGSASHDLKEIVSAAFAGRVEYLFLADGARRRGNFDENKMTATFEDEETLDNFDLYDYCAAQTLAKGGKASVADRDQIPGKSDIAAVFRY